MKHYLGPILVTAGLSAPVIAMAESNLAIYGVVDAAVESIKSGDARALRVQSGGLYQSRIGLRGSEDMGGGLKAIFNLENRYNLDDGSLVQGILFGGRAVVGLSGNWGTVTAGREYNPIYQIKVYSNPFGVDPYSVTQVLMRGGASRANNALRYDSPTWSGISVGAMYSAGDENPANSSAGRHAGLSVQYANGPLWMGAAWNHVNVESAATEDTDEWLIGARYNFGPASLYGNYWEFKTANRTTPDAETVGWVLGATVKAGARGLVLASYGVRNSRSPAAVANDDADQFLIGYEYSLSKRTTAYTQFTTITNKGRSNITVSGFANTGAGTANVSDPRAFQVGIRHTF
ncbi:porin [Herbaspirillum sp. GCM10030257]|uniref:porin n=1 Tax=Herbaspirillum sp. GCM10030257 TaxID=3273393 RepID=UPI00360E3731